jgi:Helix-turn-helix domain
MQSAAVASGAHATAPILLDDEYMDEAALAATLGIRVTTVRKWRRIRKGPPFIPVGRKLYYRRETFTAWMRSQERSFEVESEKARRRAARG